MTTKILINAAQLSKLMEAEPEIEIELIKNGAAQVAERLLKRVKETVAGEAFFNEIIRKINSELNYKYHMPDTVMKVIRTIVSEEIAKFNRDQAEVTARKHYDEALMKYTKQLESKIDSMAATIIEKKVNAVFAAAARLK